MRLQAQADHARADQVPRREFPICSIIRPSQTEGAALGAAKALTAMGLFNEQSPDFFAGVKALAEAATDAAQRQ